MAFLLVCLGILAYPYQTPRRILPTEELQQFNYNGSDAHDMPEIFSGNRRRFVRLRLVVPIKRMHEATIMARKQNVTFADIAKYTNFSKTTISRYFNNPDSLTEKNQKIIADALEKLNYQENKVARILASGQTEFVGVIIPNLFLHYYSEMLDRILSTYETFGYKFLVFLSNGDADTERQYIQELLAYKIEGLIILSHAIPSMELANLHIPIVAIEREDAHISSINTDNYMGAIQATSLLYRHNCEVLFHINNPTAKSIPAYGRIEGFEDFCREQQIPHRVFLHEMKDQTASQEHLKEILSEIEADSPGRKKGIFVSNDTHASILVNLLVRKYGKLPEDYLIVGFDDSPASRNAIFPISTVAQQIDVLATEAVKLLVEQIEEHKNSKHTSVSEPVHKMITPVLIRRETTERDPLAEND